MFLGSNLGDAFGEMVKGAIENGVDLINTEQGGLDIAGKGNVALLTLIAQILATIILFLIVRFCFWDKVTNLIESRKNAVQASLDKAKNAEDGIEEAKLEAKDTVDNARLQANNIIQQARVTSVKESEKIMTEAREQIDLEKTKALNEIKQNEKELKQNIQQEIVDVAYLLADKMVSRQMDEEKNKQVVDEFLNNDGNFKC